MGTILPSRLRSPFEHTGEAKVALFPRLPLLAKGSCLPQQTEGLPLRGTLWAFFAPECPFGAFRCSAWLFQFRQRTALSELKRSCFRFASLTLRCRTEPALRAAPVFRSAYFPIPHRPTFGAPVFRSAYSASRNARASAAFAASIQPYLCSKTLGLQPLRSPSGGRGELRSPLHPPLPPPLFIGRFAAFDRQIPKEDVFIPPNAAIAQLSLAHSAAFCYSFLNNRTRCGKRRLLP